MKPTSTSGLRNEPSAELHEMQPERARAFAYEAAGQEGFVLMR